MSATKLVHTYVYMCMHLCVCAHISMCVCAGLETTFDYRTFSDLYMEQLDEYTFNRRHSLDKYMQIKHIRLTGNSNGA